MRLEQLLAHAADLGIAVDWADLLVGRRGEYRDLSRRIVLSGRLTRAQAVSTLAHELGHAHYGDWCSTPATEARAWEYGACLAISEAEYREAERVAGPHPNAIAAELGVTRRVVEAWAASYVRRGAYVMPRALLGDSRDARRAIG